MPNYYIINNEGFFKKYYNHNATNEKEKFVTSVRMATTYVSVEEAKEAIISQTLNLCFVIDQNGQQQS